MNRQDDEPRTADDEIAIAASAPVVSLALGSVLLAASFPLQAVNLDLAFIPAMVGGANFLLGLFNIVPALPMDGGRVLHGFVWRMTGDAARAPGSPAASGAMSAAWRLASGSR